MSQHTPQASPPVTGGGWRILIRTLLWVPWVLAVAVGMYALGRFTADEAVGYRSPAEHFKYGSTGGERESGFPYWIWRALPEICPEFLPGEGYASLGMIYEPGRDLPVGVSKRFNLGIDRVFLNCAVCHTSTVRDAPDAPPRLVLGMPAHRFDIRAFETFFFDCASSARFRSEFIGPWSIRWRSA